MRNKALENTVFVYATGAFGVFFRWLQLQLAFDERGLCGPSVFNWIVTFFLLLAAWVLYRRAGDLLGRKYTLPGTLQEVFGETGKFFAFLRWFAGVLMMLGGALLIRGSETEKYVLMLRVLGGLAILTGLSFPLMLAGAKRPEEPRLQGLLRLLSLVPVALFALWLVYDYRSNAINSVVWGFLVEVLAVCVLMLGFFRLAGFAYGQKDEKKQIFWLQYGVFMSLVVLADDRSTSMQIIFFSAGMMLALADYVLLGKLREKREAESAKEPPEKEAAPPDNGGFDRLS